MNTPFNPHEEDSSFPTTKAKEHGLVTLFSSYAVVVMKLGMTIHHRLLAKLLKIKW